VQAVLVEPKTGKQYGGADPRREGTVIGLPRASRVSSTVAEPAKRRLAVAGLRHTVAAHFQSGRAPMVETRDANTSEPWALRKLGRRARQPQRMPLRWPNRMPAPCAT
jgi:hypothetical protein